MSIKFACSCGKAYKVPEKFSGKRVKCKDCGEAIRVPSETESSIPSGRAAAVSKRSVVSSQRVPGMSGRSAPSGSSGRAPVAAPRRAGSGTERFEPVDLNEGGEQKAYARKRTDEEFKRGEGRLTLFDAATKKPSKAFRLGKDDVTIGRGDCTIKVPLASVSKEHAKVEYKLGTYIITDMQSSNGVLVNGRVVRRASLKDGDLLQLGEAILRLDC